MDLGGLPVVALVLGAAIVGVNLFRACDACADRLVARLHQPRCGGGRVSADSPLLQGHVRRVGTQWN